MLTGLGISVEEFRKLPAYGLALDSGRYDWLLDLEELNTAPSDRRADRGFPAGGDRRVTSAN